MQQLLSAKLDHKATTMRSFSRKDKFEVGCDGLPFHRLPQTSWTASGIYITGVRARNNKITVKGVRVAFAYKPARKAWQPIRLRGDNVEIDVRCRRAQWTQAQIATLETGLFFSNDRQLAAALPPYWQDFFDGKATKDLPYWSASSKRVPRGATQAVALYTPEPAYPSLARSIRPTGVLDVKVLATVETNGRLDNFELARPAGLGMDEAAVATLRRWRFRPATNAHGTPIPKKYVVDITFTLLP